MPRVPAPPADPHRHLTAEEMAKVLIAWQDPAEPGHQAISHLLASCLPCQEIAERVRRVTFDYAHWNHSFALAETLQAPELWRRLEALPFPEQLAAVSGDATYQTWGFCRLLQRLSRDAAARRPPQAEKAADQANLAVAVSSHLEPAYDPEWIEDLQARSYALLGDARRQLSEPHGAADAFELSRLCLSAGTGYPSVEAEVLALEALLRRDQRRLVTAAGLFDRVAQLHTGGDWRIADPDVADPHLGSRALLHRAWCVYHVGQAATAAALLDEAAPLLDERREPPLGLALRHGQIWAAIALRRFDVAGALLPPAAALAVELGDEPVRLRLRRAAARIAAAAGERGPAEQALREAAAGFAEIGQGVDAALAILELADLFLRTGAGDAIQPLAADLFAVFSAGDVLRREFAALLFLQQTFERELVTVTLAERLAVSLERDRRPCLTWWSGWGTVLSLETVERAERSA